jgi:hypothetical protein
MAHPSSSVAADACDLSAVSGARELHETLSRRAVEVVKRASSPQWASDVRLAQLVRSDASVDLGAGDVGRPLGHGLAGARALAETMQADTYTFAGWDYMDRPATPCGAHKVTIEFTNTSDRRTATVEFQFDAGRVNAAKGWERSFETGSLR